jgi:hypothetical protein
MTRRRYLYICGTFSPGVYDSQVINWIENLDKENIHFDILSIPGVIQYVKKFKQQRKFIKKIKKKIVGNVYTSFISFPNDTTIIKDVLIFLTLWKLLLLSVLRNEKILIQTRYQTISRSLKWFKICYKNIVIISDIRGAGPEEFLLKNQDRQITHKEKLKNYYRRLNQQLQMISVADVNFCVSHELVNYFKDKKVDIIKRRFYVFPGAADSQQFYFNKEIRNKIRKDLGVENKIVIIYCGQLHHKWQVPHLLFEIISNIMKIYENKIFFICLTPDNKIVEKNMKKFKIDEKNILSKLVKNNNINDYLNAADVGILIRQRHLTNKVSSPTKFAEYVLSGLSVIISEEVGDFSKFVEKNKLGIVINDNIPEIVDAFDRFIMKKQYDRGLISKLGKKALSKQATIKKKVELYRSV